MIPKLMKRDPAWTFALKLTLAAAIAVPFCSLKQTGAFLAGMAGSIYAVAFMQAMPHRRATFFEAALPVTGRDLFLARFLSVLSLIWLPGAVTAVILSLTSFDARTIGAVVVVDIMLTLAVTVVMSVRLSQFAAPGWLSVFCPVLVATALIPALTYGHGLMAGAIGAAAAIVVGVTTWRRIPEAFQSAPMEAPAGRKRTGSAAPSTPWWPVIRSLFPWQSAIFIPISAMWAASGDWLFAPMYLMIGYNQTRLTTRWLQSLPVSRRAMLAATLFPMLLVLAGGAEFPALTGIPQHNQEFVRQGDPDHFRATGTLDVFVSRAFWRIAPNGAIPMIQAPWGESYHPPPLRLLGLTLYNPYAVGEKNSWTFQEWQFARATSDIYGQAMTPREMAKRKFGPLHPITQTPRMQILTVAAFICMGLFWAWLIDLASWHRLGRFSVKVRSTVGMVVMLIPILSMIGLDLFVGGGFATLSKPAFPAALLFISSRLPASSAAVAGIALIPILLMFWIVDLQSSAAEISQKAVENQSLFGRLGSRP